VIVVDVGMMLLLILTIMIFFGVRNKKKNRISLYVQKTLHQLKLLIQLKQFPNIVVKFGRYVPKCEAHFDEVLGIKLASPNQYAERIS
jgi:hypothetical protein